MLIFSNSQLQEHSTQEYIEKGEKMKILTLAKYSSEAITGMVQNPMSRTKAVSEVFQGAGVKIHSIDFILGDWDVMLVAEADSLDQYTAVILTIVSSGSIEDWKTYPLISDEEFTKGMEISNKLVNSYKKPN